MPFLSMYKTPEQNDFFYSKILKVDLKKNGPETKENNASPVDPTAVTTPNLSLTPMHAQRIPQKFLFQEPAYEQRQEHGMQQMPAVIFLQQEHKPLRRWIHRRR